MTGKLKEKLRELEKKAKITDIEHMEQALLAVMEYERRKLLSEQDISLTDECADIINRLNGRDIENVKTAGDKAVEAVVKKIRSGVLEGMGKDELREALRFRTEEGLEPCEPNESYFRELLGELRGQANESAEHHSDKEGKQSLFRLFRLRRPKLFKGITTAVVVVIVLAATQITVRAVFQKDIFGSVLNWSKDMFVSLIGGKSEKDKNFVATSQNKEYNSLEEFTSSENINIVVPKYMPNDLTIEKLICTNDSENIKVHIIYAENVSLYVYINQNVIPQDYNDVSETYIINSKKHYIYNEIFQVDWYDDYNTYSLMGNFTKEEFKQIIDSLYD